MKILESEEIRNAEAREAAAEKRNQKQKPGSNATDLTKYRKKQKKKQNRHMLLKLTVILLGIAALALVWVNAETIFEPLRGIASKVETKTSYDAGYPIELPASSDYSLVRTGDSYSLLTDTYLYEYDTDGAQLYALKHGYSNPEQAVSDKRILLYDKAGFTFAMYSKTSLLYKKATDDKIVYASVGSDNLAAVVTRSDRYSNILYVYDDGGNWKYTRKFADESVMQVCFTGDGEHVIVSTLGSLNGDIITNFYKFSIKQTEGNIWKYTLRDNSMSCGLYADKSNVIAVCDNEVLSIDCANGTLNGSTSYSGTLRNFVITPGYAVIHYNDISSNKNILLVMNASAESTTMANISSHTADLAADEDGIYTLDGTKLHTYDYMLIDDTVTPVGNEGYSKFVKIGNSVFMLGYRNIDKAELTSVTETEKETEETAK